LKANKVNLFVSSVLFVFWYHSPNVLDTPHIWNISRLRVKGQGMILSFERGSSRSYCVEEPFWKRLWTCRESDRILNELMKEYKVFYL
jgi:hypothetical protein